MGLSKAQYFHRRNLYKYACLCTKCG